MSDNDFDIYLVMLYYPDGSGVPELKRINSMPEIFKVLHGAGLENREAIVFEFTNLDLVQVYPDKK